MKKRPGLSLWVLSLSLSLFLFLSLSPAHAEAWPASREELAALNLTAPAGSWVWNGGLFTGDMAYQGPEDEWAELWALKNYGENSVILSSQEVINGAHESADVELLLDGYRWLCCMTCELRLIPETPSEDLAPPGDAYTVSVQVVYLKSGSPYGSAVSTLVGFLPPGETFRDLHEVQAYLRQDPRFADSLAELRTVVPDGVREIDLRPVLGGDVLNAWHAWMLNADVCVILLTPEDEGCEIVLLDTRDLAILSRTPVPNADDLYDEGWEEGGFSLVLSPQDWDGSGFFPPSYIKAVIAADGTVDVSVTQSRLTVMPGGKTAIRDADDGSLYAVDLATGGEELLIQGVAGEDDMGSYEAYLNYIPWPDDTGYDVKDEEGNPLPFPLDEESYHNNAIWLYRSFHVYKPLDEYRFVYTAYGWEWSAGFGVYDLRTRTDHRITGVEGRFYGMGGNTLYGSALMADADTYEASPLPDKVRKQLEELEALEEMQYDWQVAEDISPDGRLLALLDMASEDGDSTVTVTDLRTGNLLKAYEIYNPFANKDTVAFCGDTRLMLFCTPRDLGSAYLYLFNVGE